MTFTQTSNGDEVYILLEEILTRTLAAVFAICWVAITIISMFMIPGALIEHGYLA